MTLGWDILLDGVSIKEKVYSFNLVKIKGAYADELSIYVADADFYDLIDITTTPSLRIEVKTRIASTWISQGFFFIEQPLSRLNKDGSTSPGIWGRSKTALAGSPFVNKVAKAWTEDTTVLSIITEMADLCGLVVNSEIDNYIVFANSYVVDSVYPIDVINQLVGYAGGYVSCDSIGNLILKKSLFHPTAADYSIDDDDIIYLSESARNPDFGNRIRIGTLGSTAGITVNLVPLDGDDCLPANGTATGILLAFVLDSDGAAIQDNTVVSWATEEGLTLTQAKTTTGDYLLSAKKHTATTFYEVSVDFPIKEVIGIWAYSDSGNKHNFWESEYGSFDGSTITVRKPFSFCDQALRITYVTSGCAVNSVVAGTVARDVKVTADVDGAFADVIIKLGNTCACGSSLNAKINPSDAICLGNLANVLVWATISKIPATGHRVEIRLTRGCGSLSSENKVLKNVSILNEASYVENVISGVSQVSVEVNISSTQLPAVYAKTDTGKTNNLYAFYNGKVIDLNTVLSTGAEVVIDYRAEGATLVAWRTLGATKDCDAEVTITMADGTEAGLYDVISLRAKDCTVETSIPPEENEDTSDFDPSYDDQGDDSTGGFEDSGNEEEEAYESVDPCFTTVMDRILNIDTATNDEERDAIRFGTKSAADCPEDGENDCACSELCESEVMSEGNIVSEDRTIHDIVTDTYEKGTPEYNEEFATVMANNIASCSEDCENNRESVCGDCDEVSGPDQLAPGDSAEYICTDGVSKIITMPEGYCGILTETVGCCSVDIRSTDGQWVQTIDENSGTCYARFSFYRCETGDIIKGGLKINAGTICAHACNVEITRYPCAGEHVCDSNEPTPDWRWGDFYKEYEWECL